MTPTQSTIGSSANLRAGLSSGPGTWLQLAVFMAAALAIPSASVLATFALAGLAAISLCLNGDNKRTVGFRAPRRRLAWWMPEAIVIGVLWQYAAVGVLTPLLSQFLGGGPAAQSSQPLLTAFFIFAVLQPCAKALAYRAFLLARLEQVFGRSQAAIGISIALAALAFGLSNRHQGWAGVAVGACTGAVLNALYYWEGRSVWPTVMAHAAFNAAALTLLYLGGL